MQRWGDRGRLLLDRLRQLLANASARPTFAPIYMGDHTVLLRTAHSVGRSYKLYVDTRDVSLTPHLVTEGVWEPAVSRVIESYVKSGMRVVEVGANVGFHTLHLADLVGASGQVMCFEANARLAQLLATSIEVNGFRERTIVKSMAAADREGEAEFKLFERHLGASSFVVADGTAEHYHDSITRVTVPLTTLDVACVDWPAIDFLKIDAEGAEPMVLAGAAAVLARSPRLKMLLEFGPAFFPSSEAAAAFLDGFVAQGFSVRRVAPDGALAPADRAALLDPTKLEELLIGRGE